MHVCVLGRSKLWQDANSVYNDAFETWFKTQAMLARELKGLKFGAYC